MFNEPIRSMAEQQEEIRKLLEELFKKEHEVVLLELSLNSKIGGKNNEILGKEKQKS